MAFPRRTVQFSLLLALTGIVLLGMVYLWLQHRKSAQPCLDGERITSADCRCLAPMVAVDGFCTRAAANTEQVRQCDSNADCPAGQVCAAGDCLPQVKPAAASPPPPPQLDLSPWRVGHTWRYRYQEIPARPAREDLFCDHVVERKLDGMEPDGLGGFRLTLTQRGGAAKRSDSTVLHEAIAPGGIGDALLTAPPQEAMWPVPGQGEQKVWVLKSDRREFWIHPKLGKVREVFKGTDGKQVSSELIGWQLGQVQGGDMTTPIRWCQWTDNGGGADGWLKSTGDSLHLNLRNGQHGFVGVTGTRNDEDGSELVVEGFGKSRTINEPAASLLVAKAWADPVNDVEWVVGFWRSPLAGTVVTMTRLNAQGVETFREQLSYRMVPRETADHYLYLLQRGNDCVVGAGYGHGEQERTLAFFRLLPDVAPVREGGSWN